MHMALLFYATNISMERSVHEAIAPALVQLDLYFLVHTIFPHILLFMICASV